MASSEIDSLLRYGSNGEFSDVKRFVITAPSNQGAYYHGWCVDPVPGETNLNINCLPFGIFNVGVDVCETDLVVSLPSVTDNSPAIGGSFTLSSVVRNLGCHTSLSSTLHFYRSKDAAIDLSDMEVGTGDVGEISGTGLVYPPESSTQSIELAAPSTAGTYYYGACVDSVPNEPDMLKMNNCSGSVRVEVQ